MASQLFHLSIFSPFWPLLLTPTSEPSLPLFIKPKFNHQKPDSALLSLSLIFPTTPQNRREEGLLCFALGFNTLNLHTSLTRSLAHPNASQPILTSTRLSSSSFDQVIILLILISLLLPLTICVLLFPYYVVD